MHHALRLTRKAERRFLSRQLSGTYSLQTFPVKEHEKKATTGYHRVEPTVDTSPFFEALALARRNIPKYKSPARSASDLEVNDSLAASLPVSDIYASSGSVVADAKNSRLRLSRKTAVLAKDPLCGTSENDPSRAPPVYIDAIEQVDSCSVYLVSLTPARQRFLPTPSNPKILLQNILHMIYYRRDPPPSVNELLRYHNQPQTKRSTATYNLLIRLAIRHAAFGIVSKLFEDMQAEDIDHDMETWKLRTRFLVRTGCWDTAWKMTKDAVAKQHPYSRFCQIEDKRGIPLFIWFEFAGTMKKGALRKWEGDKVVPIEETTNELEMFKQRYSLLLQNTPLLTADQTVRTPPRMIHFMVEMMHRLGKHSEAVRITKSYLKRLPSTINPVWSAACLEIIHLHITYSEPGMGAFMRTRKRIYKMLESHTQLIPNSKTLLLLMHKLDGIAQCGTLAWDLCRSFHIAWQSRFQDTTMYSCQSRAVRRKMIRLAVKENRWDLVEQLFQIEHIDIIERQVWGRQREIIGERIQVPAGGLRVGTNAEMIRRRGVENKAWQRLQRTVMAHLRKKSVFPSTRSKRYWTV